MLAIVLRAVNAVGAVLTGIVVGSCIGDDHLADLTTVSITSGIVALAEWAMTWLPRRSRRARELLDPRAVFSGVWIQEKVHSHGESREATTTENRFALFSVSFRPASDSYTIEGTAYDDAGEEYARWRSVELVHFAKDGRSLTYLWDGTVTSAGFAAKSADSDRTGFSRLELTTDDAGRGRVEHVARNIVLEFDLQRVTPAWLAAKGHPGVDPEQLLEPGPRDDFARHRASALVRPR